MFYGTLKVYNQMHCKTPHNAASDRNLHCLQSMLYVHVLGVMSPVIIGIPSVRSDLD